MNPPLEIEIEIEAFEQKLIEGAPVLDKHERAMCLNLYRQALERVYEAGKKDVDNYITSVTHRVFKNPEDEKLEVPPLFEAQVTIQHIDFSRVKSVPDVDFRYELISPNQTQP